jgi:tripartite-type tricarboxylate transporter receptor subunit TctC
VIVDNKPGASGNIGHDFVAKAAPDGYTLGIGAMGPLAVNPSLYPKLNFDPLKDFTPIVLIERAPLVLVTRADKPFKSMQDVVEAAKANPGRLTIGNAGPGGAHHEQTYAALPSIQAGKTRALAVTSAKRLPSLPNAGRRW